MKGKLWMGIFALFLVALAAVAVQAQTVPLDITEVQIDDVEVVESDLGTNKLDVERGEEFELEIHLEATADADDIEIEAFVSGYEYNDAETISARTHTFSVDAGVKYVKKLNLQLPLLMDSDEYKLRLIVSDRYSDEIVMNFDLLVDSKRHDLKFSDIILYPEANVESGTALLARVRLENFGQKDEDDVKVRVSIQDLGISALDYINEIETGDEEETEEMYMKIPCAAPGEYTVEFDVTYDNGHESLNALRTISISEGFMCKQMAAATAGATQVDDSAAADDAGAEAVDAEADEGDSKANVRTALEIILLVLVALLVIIGLVVGFSRMRDE